MAKKLTKKHQAALAAEQETRLQALEALHTRFHNKTLPGVVHWFDEMSGEGLVHVDGTSAFLSFTVIDGIDKNNMHWPAEHDRAALAGLSGKTCRVDIWVTGSGQLMVEKCILSA